MCNIMKKYNNHSLNIWNMIYITYLDIKVKDLQFMFRGLQPMKRLCMSSVLIREHVVILSINNYFIIH